MLLSPNRSSLLKMHISLLSTKSYLGNRLQLH